MPAEIAFERTNAIPILSPPGADMTRPKKKESELESDTEILPNLGRTADKWVERYQRVGLLTLLIAALLFGAHNLVSVVWADGAKPYIQGEIANRRQQADAEAEQTKALTAAVVQAMEEARIARVEAADARRESDAKTERMRESLVQVTMALASLRDEIREIKKGK